MYSIHFTTPYIVKTKMRYVCQLYLFSIAFMHVCVPINAERADQFYYFMAIKVFNNCERHIEDG